MSDIVRRLRSLNLWAQDDWKDTVSEAADEITRLQKELETAREALSDIANDKLRDETWPEHYWRLVEVARSAIRSIKPRADLEASHE